MSVGTSSAPGAGGAPRPPAPRAPGDLAAPAGLGVDPDQLPDGLVVADEHGRVVCFNAAAARITATPAAEALGRPLESALPLEDLEGRRWWQLTDPYGGLAIRVRQPERNLLLPGGREVLVTARYVRTEPL
ncbi:PAS domain-containing protein, partial [Streptomyces sp. SID6013]|nr:PAS domain-containing protein [Streptomyces sp. SID6013]